MTAISIDGMGLTGVLRLAGHRWVFDLMLSNPDAVRLYRMSPGKYMAAVGCAR